MKFFNLILISIYSLCWLSRVESTGTKNSKKEKAEKEYFWNLLVRASIDRTELTAPTVTVVVSFFSLRENWIAVVCPRIKLKWMKIVSGSDCHSCDLAVDKLLIVAYDTEAE